MLESIPPESSAPSGTSATRRRSTAAADLVANEVEPLLVAPGLELARSSAYALDAHRRRSRRRAGARAAASRSPREAGAAGDVLQREVGVELRRVDLAPHAREPQQRLHLGREGERAVREPRVDERLLADAVAREHEPLAASVPEREREHALDSRSAKPRPCSSYRCGITGVSPVPRTSWPDELGAQLAGSCRARR